MKVVEFAKYNSMQIKLTSLIPIPAKYNHINSKYACHLGVKFTDTTSMSQQFKKVNKMVWIMRV